MRLLFELYNRLRKYKVVQTLKDWLYQVANKVLDYKLKGGFINSDINKYDLNVNSELMRLQRSGISLPIKSITWFIPAFSEPHAGMNNIFEFIKYLMNKGISINIVLLANKIGIMYCQNVINTDSKYKWLKQANIFHNSDVSKLPYTDAGVATACDTAYSLLKYNKTRSKFYFIQDDERMMYTDVYKKRLAENTYKFGFGGIATAKCLERMYKEEFCSNCESYFTALNIQQPYVLKHKSSIERLFFYARPEKEQERNGFKYGLEGLKEIKKRHNGLEIVTAGSNKSFNDEGIGIIQLGNLPLDIIEDFYSTCDVGISILLSRHTGVIPFELMAMSVAVLTNKQEYANDYIISGYNCITFELNPISIADAFDKLYYDLDLYNEIIKNGYNFVNSIRPVEEEIARVSKKLFGV
jgi:glycosyltransferase involved in cell wall biosynthesis